MKQVEMFGKAIWIGAKNGSSCTSMLIKRSFFAGASDKAIITLIGLGTFELFVNGKRVSEDYFLPLNSEYEFSGLPKGEELGFSIYATRYDISEYIKDGENILSVILGLGWYTGTTLWKNLQKVYGNKKLIYSIDIENSVGEKNKVISDGSEYYIPAFVTGGHLHIGEEHNYEGWSWDYISDSSTDGYMRVEEEKAVESDYLFTDCPADRIFEYIEPTLIYECDEYKLYDAKRNTTGYPILLVDGDEYKDIKVVFSERLDDSLIDLDATHIHDQSFTARARADSGALHPHFTWYAYRFFKVYGDARVDKAAVLHADVKVDSDFKTNDETLNWIYNTFVDTQLANMHRGIPSDCPHIERLGYTGDGQNTCRSVLHILDGYDFYKKWIRDITDSQDRATGHVQNTAPYIFSGGGPGGWGSAIVTVPYEFWKYYGDKSVLEECFPFMLKYLDFLLDHSEFYLVTSDSENCTWCLGDWCTPPDQSNLPAPFVNTFFHIRSIQRTLEIAEAIGKSDEVEYLKERMEKCIYSFNRFYLNSLDRDMTYVGNVRGASAFAINIGLGNEKTREKLANYYQRLGYYDTGIFGTELVTRTLFEIGRADVAYTLLTTDEPFGFGKWKKNGETSFPEYWNTARSHNHPMFGAVVACLFEYILGIRQQKDSSGYDKVIISPVYIWELTSAEGYITTPHGKIFVSYQRRGEETEYAIEIPEGVSAILEIPGMDDKTVGAGKYVFKV